MGAGIYYSLTDFSSISRLTNSLPANIAQTLTNSTLCADVSGLWHQLYFRRMSWWGPR